MVDYMIRILQQKKNRQDTLFLAVRIFDLYLSKTTTINKSKIDLIGTVSLMIATKYNEMDN